MLIGMLPRTSSALNDVKHLGQQWSRGVCGSHQPYHHWKPLEPSRSDGQFPGYSLQLPGILMEWLHEPNPLSLIGPCGSGIHGL